MVKISRIRITSRVARLSVIGVCLTPVLLLAGTAGTPAAASTSVPVTIQCTVIIGPFTGTWTASGGINDAGTLVQPVDFRVGQGRVVHLIRVMTGSKGSITLIEDNLLGPTVGTGHWAIIAGTGAYAELHGDGTTRGVVVNGVVTDTLTGSVHYN